MYRHALRNVLAHRARLLMTGLAVLLGTAFVAGTLVFSDSVGQAFRDSLSSSFAGVSVQVTDASAGTGSGPKDLVTSVVPLTDATVRKLAALPDAAGARGIVTGYAGLVDTHGLLIGRTGSTYGANWVPGTDGSDPRYPMVGGVGPAGAQQVAVDRTTADRQHINVGDTVRVAVNGPVRQLTVTGLFSTDDPQVKAGGSLLLFDTATAQSHYLAAGRYDAVTLAAGPGVSQDQLLAEVRTALPQAPNLKMRTAAQLRSDQLNLITTATLGLTIALLGFAGIALFVATFLIANTFTMLVAERLRELALLRALGASRRQVTRSVLIEALVVGAGASALGLLAGVGIGLLMQTLLGAMGGPTTAGALVVSPTTIVATLGTGIVVTVVSALLPARRAARVAPVAAMSSVDAPATQRSLVVRNSIGLALAGLGLAAVLIGAGQHGSSGRSTVGVGALLLMLGVFVLTPLLSRPAMAAVGPFYRRLFGVAGRLARQNAARNPRRTAATASALTVGVTLISLLTVVGASMTAAVDRSVTQGLVADYRVSGAQVDMPLPPATVSAIADTPGVAVAASLDMQALRPVQATDILSVYGVDPTAIGKVLTPAMVSGSFSALGQGQLLVEQEMATRYHVTVGGALQVAYPDGTRASLTVGGIYGNSHLVGPSMLSESLLRMHTARPFYDGVLVKGTDGATARLQQALRDATGDNPLVVVRDRQQLQDAYNSTVTLLLRIIDGLLAMAVVMAVLGVVNTLAMSVVERRRELGTLRAIGLDRSGVRRMVRLEAVAIAGFGAVLGVLLGVLLGWATVRLSADSFFGLTTVLPFGQLAGYLVGGVLVGLLAALWPARRAVRMGVLDGIRSA